MKAYIICFSFCVARVIGIIQHILHSVLNY